MTETANTNQLNLNDKLIIGVTGGIGSGKSALTAEFEKLNVVVVDADVVAREVVAVNSPALMQIVNEFGPDILLSTGELNRVKLREIIFSDEQSKQTLNAIMHPAIRNELIQQLIHAKSSYVILSAPLLFENKLDKLTDKVVVVDVPEHVQVNRASSRDDVEQEQIKAIMASQFSREQRNEKADYLVANEHDISLLAKQVIKLNTEFLRLSADKLGNRAI
ncbi:dephospho-CoA kinase [Psychrosphaera saromensis]|uniref:Dephospho-CoA kinase n=1 Tax=Psychrosphaera saromensis TaxID=716813 RepID=A0A2S7URB9_9GAMM|nr:dephospho-CoA kinase [Psychrosphaera saromensis]PQJ52285.1 dephospho-CoA kinase [Psychrosphaera saromensis]GHB72477.1 dephospho-CoA kinase [Psychrosphaera saromensis]GLQ13564.1 dephospho-CoA kinase [Psychrosphaera saromensis]